MSLKARDYLKLSMSHVKQFLLLEIFRNKMESHEEAHVKILMDQLTCAGDICKKWMFIPNFRYKNMDNSCEIAGFGYISLESGHITLKTM